MRQARRDRETTTDRLSVQGSNDAPSDMSINQRSGMSFMSTRSLPHAVVLAWLITEYLVRITCESRSHCLGVVAPQEVRASFDAVCPYVHDPCCHIHSFIFIDCVLVPVSG